MKLPSRRSPVPQANSSACQSDCSPPMRAQPSRHSRRSFTGFVKRSSRSPKTILLFLLSASMFLAAEPTREGGLTVHMLPDHVAKISGGRGGFTIKDPPAAYAEPKDLLTYFQGLPASVRENGIWIVTTHPSSYSEAEQSKLKSLGALCAEQKIPVFTCRGAELPNGWKRLE